MRRRLWCSKMAAISRAERQTTKVAERPRATASSIVSSGAASTNETCRMSCGRSSKSVVNVVSTMTCEDGTAVKTEGGLGGWRRGCHLHRRKSVPLQPLLLAGAASRLPGYEPEEIEVRQREEEDG